MRSLVFFFVCIWLGFGCQAVIKNQPDKIIYQVKIWSDTLLSADAVSLRGDTILQVGYWKDLKVTAGPNTELIDGQNGLLVPGFIDSHVHLREGSQSLISVQLRDASTPEEFIARIAKFCSGRDTALWVLGGLWNHELWGGTLPTRHWIDSVSENVPVFLNRLDGHMAVANTAAIIRAGLRLDDQNIHVEGGEIVRDEQGLMTGVFKDNAMDLIYRRIPPTPVEEEDKGLDSAMQYLLSQGVTSVHNMGTWEDVEWFEKIKEQGKLDIRIYACTPLSQWQKLADLRKNLGNHDDKWLKVGGLKGFMDGSLGSHTAAFFDDFTDKPGDQGFLINKEEDMAEWITAADSAGLHCVIHAIGDRANHLLLNIFESLNQKHGPRDRRFRIEHAQHFKSDDILRTARLGIIPSMQPYHAIDDGCWAEKVIGPERAKTSYAFKSFFDMGATVAFGSDWFVAPADVLAGIDAAVKRQTLDGKHPEGWHSEQCISVEQALRAYTRNAAFSVFEEASKGTIAPGYLADLVLLDHNIIRSPRDLKNTQVKWTMVGGMIKYQGL